MIAAGSDTVANAVTIGTFYVLNNERILAALVRELEQAWPDASVNKNYEMLEKVPYLVHFSSQTRKYRELMDVLDGRNQRIVANVAWRCDPDATDSWAVGVHNRRHACSGWGNILFTSLYINAH